MDSHHIHFVQLVSFLKYRRRGNSQPINIFTIDVYIKLDYWFICYRFYSIISSRYVFADDIVFSASFNCYRLTCSFVRGSIFPFPFHLSVNGRLQDNASISSGGSREGGSEVDEDIPLVESNQGRDFAQGLLVEQGIRVLTRFHPPVSIENPHTNRIADTSQSEFTGGDIQPGHPCACPSRRVGKLRRCRRERDGESGLTECRNLHHLPRSKVCRKQMPL